jgi:CDP-glucose 4,6-dehydratase
MENKPIVENMVDIKKSFEGFYKNKRVLVTGHTGFKGSWLVIWLIELGAKVSGYSLKPNTNPNNFDLCLLKDKINNNFEDIRNKEKLKKVIINFKPEIIFHLAAQPLVIPSYKNPYYNYDVNIMGLVNLFEIVRSVSFVKNVIVVTSDKCYKNKEIKRGYKETDELGGSDPYSSSKSCAEIISASYYNSFLKVKKINLATARAGNVIGGGDWADYRLVPDFIKSLIKNKKLLIRNPESVRPWQFVLEPLSGYLKLGQKLSSGNDLIFSSWNFGPSNRSVNVSTLIRKISALWGSNESIKLSEVKNNYKETNNLKLNINNSRKYLKWKPVYKLQDTLKKTIEWYKLVYEGEKDVYKLCKNQIIDYTNKAQSNKN